MESSIVKTMGRKALCVGASLAMAASMTAFTPSLIQQAFAEGETSDASKYVTCASYRAAEPTPEILGLSNVASNNAWDSLGKLTWTSPYYYIFGTSEYNSNPNPLMVNSVANYSSNSTDNTPSMVTDSSRSGGPTASLPEYSASEAAQTVWNQLPDVILGNSGGANYNSENYSVAAGAANGNSSYKTYGYRSSDGSTDYGVVYDSTNIYTMIDSMYNLATAANTAAEETGKELRYGDPEEIVADFETYVKGMQGYILKQLASNGAEKKKVALVNNYDAETKTYTILPTGVAEGTAASNRYLEAVQFVATNIADDGRDLTTTGEGRNQTTTATATAEEIADCDLVMVGSQSGTETLSSTEDIVASFPADVQAKTYWASSANGSAGSCYGVVMNSVENAQNFGRILGCLYSEYVDQSDMIAYYYQNFYHINTGKLSECIANAMDGVRNWDADGSDQTNAVLWSEETVDDYNYASTATLLSEGMEYIAENASSLDTTAATYLAASAQYTAAKTDLSTATFASIDDQTYTGDAIEPSVTVTLDGKTLTKDTDYTLSYTDNVVAGATATVTAYGIGSYAGTASTTFKIAKSTEHSSAFVKYDKETGKELPSNTNASADSYDVRYFKSDGTMVTGLAKIYGYYRYFDENGNRCYGAQNVLWEDVTNDDGSHNDGQLHEMYFNETTGMMETGYLKIDKTTNTLLPSDTTAAADTYDVYYYRLNGEKLYGLAKIYGYYRYLDPSTGIRLYGLQSVKWENVTNDDSAENLSHNDGQTYEMFFDDSGDKPTGIMASGVFVRLNSNGESDSSSSDVYYFKIRGDKATEGLLKVYGYLRYFDENGVRQYGWQEVDGSTYYFDTYTGAAYTGEHTLNDPTTGEPTNYVFDTDGKLLGE